MKVEEMISAVQGRLGVQVDGRAGPETWSAIYAHVVGPTRAGARLADEIDAVDKRSERIVAALLPDVRPIARTLVHHAASAGIRIKIISGLRTFAAQDALFAQGRTRPGRKVTNARGGFSNHNFGIAFDIGVFEGTRYLPESPKYNAVGALGIELGLEWGGNWKSFVDAAHFQLRPAWARDMTERNMLAVLRERVASGTPLFA